MKFEIILILSNFKADITKLYQSAIMKYSTENMPRVNMSKINSLLVKKNREQKRLALDAELNKERHNREAWRNAFVPAYFHSEWGRKYLAQKDFEEVFITTEDNTNTTNNNNFLQTSENDFNVPNGGSVGSDKNNHFDSNNNITVENLSSSRIGTLLFSINSRLKK